MDSNAKLSFYGIEGYCRLHAVDEIARTLLIAGELVHIGKNTGFGFGRYTLVTAADQSHSKGTESRSCHSVSRPDGY